MSGIKTLLADSPYGGMPPYRRAGNETSRLAAESVKPAAPTLRARVLACIQDAGSLGRTNDEITAAAGMLLQSVCGRVAELRKLGLIVDSGMKRATASGRMAVAWRAR